MAVLVLISINLILLGICVLALIIAGIRGMIVGGQEFYRLGTILIAVVAFIVSYFVVGGVVQSCLLALLVMIVLSVLAIVFTGSKGAFRT